MKKNKIKIASIVGTRPEIIRLSRVFSILDKFCNHCLIHTGQNYDYELNQIFFRDLKIRKPDFFLNSAIKSKTDKAKVDKATILSSGSKSTGRVF